MLRPPSAFAKIRLYRVCVCVCVFEGLIQVVMLTFSLVLVEWSRPVRCCDTCDTLIQMQQMNSSALSELPLKSLKKYLEAYNLSSSAAIEKGDLVRIILNTRPISNESEIYYRSHRKPAPPTTAEEASSISRVFNEISDMIAGSIDKQEQKQQERQQQQQQQQDTYRQQQQEAYRRQQQQQRQQEAFYRQQQQQQRQQQEAYAREQQMRREQHQAMLRQQRQQQEAYRRQQRQQQQQQAGPPPSSNYAPPPHTTSRPPPNPPRPQPSPPAMRSDNFLSLDDMIQSKVDPASLSVRTLKAILKANFVEHAHVLEKSDLVSRVQRLADERKKELAARNNTSSNSGVDDATLCRICFDAQQNCVYLDCGHMVSCMDCGKQVRKEDIGMIVC